MLKCERRYSDAIPHPRPKDASGAPIKPEITYTSLLPAGDLDGMTPVFSHARRWSALTATALVAVIALVVSGQVVGENEDNLPVPTARPGSTVAVPAFPHVFVIVLENHSFEEIIGSTAAPYLNELAGRYGLGISRPVPLPRERVHREHAR